MRSEIGQLFHQHGKYSLLYLEGGKKAPRFALPTDFETGLTTLPDGKTIPVVLAQQATDEGYRYWKRGAERSYLDASMFGWLQRTIFGGKGHLALYSVPLGEGLAVLMIALFLAVPADIKRFKEIKYGRRLKGPVMVTPKEFNKVLKADGLAIKTDDKGLLIRIPKRSEPAHIQVMGDTGVGKTTLLTQMLQQIEDRGELAIVYDPAGEFTQRFYRRERGDWILNPFRCPKLLLDTIERASQPYRSPDNCRFALSTDQRQKGRLLHRDPPESVCPSAEVPAFRRRPGRLALE